MFSMRSSASKQTKSMALRADDNKSVLPSQPKAAAKDFKAFEAVQGEGVVLVGKGTHIVGEITNCSVVEIQGVLEGTVSADIVIVRDGGGFKGNFMAEQAEIHGVVEGGVTVHGLLDIRATGKVTGDVTYEELAVAVGAHVSGQITSPATIESSSPETSSPGASNGAGNPFEPSAQMAAHSTPPPQPPQLPHKHIASSASISGSTTPASRRPDSSASEI